MPRLRPFVLLIASGCARLLCAQNAVLLDGGAGVTQGGYFVAVDAAGDEWTRPRAGWGAQASAARYFGGIESALGFAIGVRLRQRVLQQARGYAQSYRSNEGGTLVGGRVKFDGLVSSQEALVGIPLQWWLKLGRRSALTINLEPGLTVWRNASEEGERSITSTAGHPDGSVSTSTRKEPYARALASRTGSAMGVLSLGYRRWLGDRMCAGADAGVSGPLSGQGWAGGPVTEVVLLLGWAIRDGVNKPVNLPD